MTNIRKLSGKVRPLLAYRKRGLTTAQFEAVTCSAISEAFEMSENALEDARSMLAALPDMGKLDELEGKTERYAFAFLHMRSMEIFREKANPFSMIELVQIVASDTNSAKALLKNAPYKRAREFVRAEWELNRSSYANNKSAFARDYVRRVWNELNVSVTEKQMREVWLRDTPTAGTQAGLQVNGE